MDTLTLAQRIEEMRATGVELGELTEFVLGLPEPMRLVLPAVAEAAIGGDGEGELLRLALFLAAKMANEETSRGSAPSSGACSPGRSIRIPPASSTQSRCSRVSLETIVGHLSCGCTSPACSTWHFITLSQLMLRCRHCTVWRCSCP